MSQSHFRALERMYLASPINALFEARIRISEARAVVEFDIRREFFHSAGSLHGSIYFKSLDDAAFFAANSLESEMFMLTASFTTYFTRPVGEGLLRAEGRVVHRGGRQHIAEAVARTAEGKEVARGSGVFVRGRKPLHEAMGYLTAVD